MKGWAWPSLGPLLAADPGEWSRLRSILVVFGFES